MNKSISMAAVAALCAGLFFATAADAKRKPLVKVVAAKIAPAFKAADADSSRQIDSSEWANAGYNADNFAKVDLNQNGTVGFWETLIVTLAKLKARGS